ncbi:MAG TPA: murein L,D-transpeptidase catalytic domain family protein [Chitinophagaceae bacterium]|nr:murein L,D-transpeptidase catalytic domain family protein [Chitinophagaceae bacterium]
MIKKALKLVSIAAVAAVLGLQLSFIPTKANHETVKAVVTHTNVSMVSKYAAIYDSLHLNVPNLSREAFIDALEGYNYLLSQGKLRNAGILSIVDFTLPSSVKRLFVIDLNNAALLFNTYVSHGRNSGKLMADEFSNAPNSFKSSLGFYVTSNTYKGKHGYSLRLEGEEQGINDNALNRGIVMHCANYVTENFIRQQGYIGRSEGCPAVPPNMYKPIINTIKDGSCLFMYSPDKYYISHSPILNGGAA